MLSRWMTATVVCSLVSLFAICSRHADNWPQWRGPRLDGISRETNIPTHWSKTENIAWRLPAAGTGGTPAVWADRIYLTSAARAREGGSGGADLRHGTDGKLLWQSDRGQRQ